MDNLDDRIVEQRGKVARLADKVFFSRSQDNHMSEKQYTYMLKEAQAELLAMEQRASRLRVRGDWHANRGARRFL